MPTDSELEAFMVLQAVAQWAMNDDVGAEFVVWHNRSFPDRPIKSLEDARRLLAEATLAATERLMYDRLAEAGIQLRPDEFLAQVGRNPVIQARAAEMMGHIYGPAYATRPPRRGRRRS